jgi:hypothetical protein
LIRRGVELERDQVLATDEADLERAVVAPDQAPPNTTMCTVAPARARRSEIAFSSVSAVDLSVIIVTV